jgi:predicted RND superfamily exporter protein
MGVGIDYGIYLLTRILQEYQRSATKDYDAAITIALETTGRAVFFTATVMTLCVGIWYFLSSFRFMADMGYLLALLMFINMLGAMLVVPALVSVLKPRFAAAARLLVWD